MLIVFQEPHAAFFLFSLFYLTTSENKEVKEIGRIITCTAFPSLFKDAVVVVPGEMVESSVHICGPRNESLICYNICYLRFVFMIIISSENIFLKTGILT